jgi:hypothetical protein
VIISNVAKPNKDHVYRYPSDYVSTKVRGPAPVEDSTEAMANDVLLVD